jgi:hypothetical protein
LLTHHQKRKRRSAVIAALSANAVNFQTSEFVLG